MTKKSLGRMQRDAEAKQSKDARKEVAGQIVGNTVYDDIRGVYEASGHVLGGYALAYNQLNVPDAIPYLDPEQQTKVVTLATGFKADIDQLTGDLQQLGKPFADRTGGEDDVDKFIETVGVVDQFQEFIGRSHGVLGPTFNQISAEVATTIKAADAQNPSVITDVEVKTENVNA